MYILNDGDRNFTIIMIIARGLLEMLQLSRKISENDCIYEYIIYARQVARSYVRQVRCLSRIFRRAWMWCASHYACMRVCLGKHSTRARVTLGKHRKTCSTTTIRRLWPRRAMIMIYKNINIPAKRSTAPAKHQKTSCLLGTTHTHTTHSHIYI